jgi:hypothetical protein
MPVLALNKGKKSGKIKENQGKSRKIRGNQGKPGKTKENGRAPLSEVLGHRLTFLADRASGCGSGNALGYLFLAPPGLSAI